MIRPVHAGAAMLLGLGACLIPTDTCACTYPPPAALVIGQVRSAAGAPVAGARVAVRASRAPCTTAADTAPFLVATTSSAGGGYRVVSIGPPEGSTCVHVRATVGGVSATATGTVRSRPDGREAFLDSVRVDIQLP